MPPAGAAVRRSSPRRAVRAVLQEGRPGPSAPPGSRWTPRSLAPLTDAGGSRLSVSPRTGLQGASVLRHGVLDLGLRPSALGHVKRRPPFPGPLFLGHSSLNVALQQSLLGLRLKYEFRWKPWKVGLLFGSLTHPKLPEWCLTHNTALNRLNGWTTECLPEVAVHLHGPYFTVLSFRSFLSLLHLPMRRD